MNKKLQILSLTILVLILSACATGKKGCNTCPDFDKKGKKYPKAKNKKRASVSMPEAFHLFV
ncbi:MAG: hypothetical protein J7604_15985 [Sporocytophaga sp.]|uniref:hypothetical protein n=1 Tax=Sporocytophaga sp. TaxID=2231183 RepID=UPI001B0A3663|nr:hypothetical protein [Sporocytophaga sp.]MBO9701707.1 hypothetical protein [Sporocytophaga sp.]